MADTPNPGNLELVGRMWSEGMTLKAERDHYRAALEATRDALADPNALAEAIDSPANKAFAIINHALAASPRKVR